MLQSCNALCWSCEDLARRTVVFSRSLTSHLISPYSVDLVLYLTIKLPRMRRSAACCYANCKKDCKSAAFWTFILRKIAFTFALRKSISTTRLGNMLEPLLPHARYFSMRLKPCLINFEICTRPRRSIDVKWKSFTLHYCTKSVSTLAAESFGLQLPCK